MYIDNPNPESIYTVQSDDLCDNADLLSAINAELASYLSTLNNALQLDRGTFMAIGDTQPQGIRANGFTM